MVTRKTEIRQKLTYTNNIIGFCKEKFATIVKEDCGILKKLERAEYKNYANEHIMDDRNEQ